VCSSDLTLPRLELLWDYYRNDLIETPERGGKPYRLAQQRGLPSRLTGETTGSGSRVSREREVVIENDIAWRIHALVDFMVGKPFALQSLAPDGRRGALIEAFLQQVFEANGGVRFFQDLALLGSVYGHVDVLLRTDKVRAIDRSLRLSAETSSGNGSTVGNSLETAGVGTNAAHSLPTHRSDAPSSGGGAGSLLDDYGVQLLDRAGAFMLETIEAPRAIPVLNPADYRKLDAYVLHFRQVLNEVDDSNFVDRLRERVLGGEARASRRASVECAEVWSDDRVIQLQGEAENRRTVSRSVNRLGRIPVEIGRAHV